MGGAKLCRFALFPLMLFMLLLVPANMVAQTPTEDSRYALFNLDGITDVTITDDGSYPWQMLDLNADGMKDLGFTIPDGSKGLMSSNYHVAGSSSETVVNFTVEKPMLLTFKYLVSSEYFDKATITLDNKEPRTISRIEQIEIKALLSVGKHSLKLSYTKDNSYNENADRTCIYDLKTATTFSEYVADYVATNSTLTFKKITSDNLEGLDLSRMAVVDNIDMVQNVCTNYSSIKNIVFDESFKTYAPTSLSEFFKGCETLETISGLEYLNTAKVTNMSFMFYGCSALTSLDLTSFNTANVTDMSYMFYGCSALKSLDLTNFNTAKVKFMDNMFNGCSALTTIYASDKFVTDNVSYGSDMFTGCKSLKGYSDSKTGHKYANCGTDGYFTPVFDYAEFDGTGTLTFRRGVSKPEEAYDLNEGANAPAWSDQSTNINKVVFDASFANARPTSCYKWFCGCGNLTQIEGVEYLNTEEVTNMAWMFKGCSNLKSLDVSKFNTAQVTDMSYMFTHCWGLESLDVSRLNTENVTNMENMFLFCSNSKLTSLDVSNFNTEKVTNMSCMFRGSSNLTSLDLSNFNTQDVKDMSYMLMDCRGLTSLDLSSFNTPNVENMSGMFNDCYDLTTIYVSDKFVTTKVSDGTDMFYGCTSLKGAIKYDDSSYGYPEYGYPGYGEGNTDHTYANYKTGYFTKLVGKNGNDKIGAVGEVLTAESLALADDKDFVAYEPFTATAASYSRTINAGTTWATLCLPFEVSLEGKNFRAFKLLSADEGAETVELEEVKTIEAGTPVIIKMKDGVNSFSFSVENTAIAKDVQIAATADGNYQLQGLYTQKEFDKEADNNCYIVKGNKLMNPAKLLENTKVQKVASKPFRAYMVDNSSSAAGAKMFSIGISDSTTAIESLNTIANDKAEYYDLQGNRLNEPQKGINIVKRNGKTMKVIIK